MTTTLIFHFPINDHGYNYDISKMQMALIEDSQVLIGEGGVKVCFILEMGPTSFQCRVTVRRHYTQWASISKALEIRLAS